MYKKIKINLSVLSSGQTTLFPDISLLQFHVTSQLRGHQSADPEILSKTCLALILSSSGHCVVWKVLLLIFFI